MRCSNCDKEFGSGTNCQNCGIDRVTGLANYNGYNNSGNSSEYNSPNYGGSPRTTVCYACSEIIPLGATYCPVCGKKLLVTCPKCGHEYSSQYPVCSKCGTNRDKYHEQKVNEERAKKEQEEKEHNTQIEAMVLKDKLSVHTNNIIKCAEVLGFIAWVMGILTLVYSIWWGDESKFILTISLIGLVILLWLFYYLLNYIGYKMIEKETQQNISLWKNRHSNDPRSNYL